MLIKIWWLLIININKNKYLKQITQFVMNRCNVIHIFYCITEKKNFLMIYYFTTMNLYIYCLFSHYIVFMWEFSLKYFLLQA